MWFSFLSNAVSQKWGSKRTIRICCAVWVQAEENPIFDIMKSRRYGWHKAVGGCSKLGYPNAIAVIDFPVKTHMNFSKGQENMWSMDVPKQWHGNWWMTAETAWKWLFSPMLKINIVYIWHQTRDVSIKIDQLLVYERTHHHSVFPLFDGKHPGASFNTLLQHTKNKTSFNPQLWRHLGAYRTL